MSRAETRKGRLFEPARGLRPSPEGDALRRLFRAEVRQAAGRAGGGNWKVFWTDERVRQAYRILYEAKLLARPPGMPKAEYGRAVQKLFQAHPDFQERRITRNTIQQAAIKKFVTQQGALQQALTPEEIQAYRELLSDTRTRRVQEARKRARGLPKGEGVRRSRRPEALGSMPEAEYGKSWRPRGAENEVIRLLLNRPELQVHLIRLREEFDYREWRFDEEELDSVSPEAPLWIHSSSSKRGRLLVTVHPRFIDLMKNQGAQTLWLEKELLRAFYLSGLKKKGQGHLVERLEAISRRRDPLVFQSVLAESLFFAWAIREGYEAEGAQFLRLRNGPPQEVLSRLPSLLEGDLAADEAWRQRLEVARIFYRFLLPYELAGIFVPEERTIHQIAQSYFGSRYHLFERTHRELLVLLERMETGIFPSDSEGRELFSWVGGRSEVRSIEEALDRAFPDADLRDLKIIYRLLPTDVRRRIFTFYLAFHRRFATWPLEIEAVRFVSLLGNSYVSLALNNVEYYLKIFSIALPNWRLDHSKARQLGGRHLEVGFPRDELEEMRRYLASKVKGSRREEDPVPQEGSIEGFLNEVFPNVSPRYLRLAYQTLRSPAHYREALIYKLAYYRQYGRWPSMSQIGGAVRTKRHNLVYTRRRLIRHLEKFSIPVPDWEAEHLEIRRGGPVPQEELDRLRRFFEEGPRERAEVRTGEKALGRLSATELRRELGGMWAFGWFWGLAKLFQQTLVTQVALVVVPAVLVGLFAVWMRFVQAAQPAPLNHLLRATVVGAAFLVFVLTPFVLTQILSRKVKGILRGERDKIRGELLRRLGLPPEFQVTEPRLRRLLRRHPILRENGDLLFKLTRFDELSQNPEWNGRKRVRILRGKIDSAWENLLLDFAEWAEAKDKEDHRAFRILGKSLPSLEKALDRYLSFAERRPRVLHPVPRAEVRHAGERSPWTNFASFYTSLDRLLQVAGEGIPRKGGERVGEARVKIFSGIVNHIGFIPELIAREAPSLSVDVVLKDVFVWFNTHRHRILEHYEARGDTATLENLLQFNLRWLNSSNEPVRQLAQEADREIRGLLQKFGEDRSLPEEKVFESLGLLQSTSSLPQEAEKRRRDQLLFREWKLSYDPVRLLEGIPTDTLARRRRVLLRIFEEASSEKPFFFEPADHPEVLRLELNHDRVARLQEAAAHGDFESALKHELNQIGIPLEGRLAEGGPEFYESRLWRNAREEVASNRDPRVREGARASRPPPRPARFFIPRAQSEPFRQWFLLRKSSPPPEPIRRRVQVGQSGRTPHATVHVLQKPMDDPARVRVHRDFWYDEKGQPRILWFRAGETGGKKFATVHLGANGRPVGRAWWNPQERRFTRLEGPVFVPSTIHSARLQISQWLKDPFDRRRLKETVRVVRQGEQGQVYFWTPKEFGTAESRVVAHSEAFRPGEFVGVETVPVAREKRLLFHVPGRVVRYYDAAQNSFLTAEEELRRRWRTWKEEPPLPLVAKVGSDGNLRFSERGAPSPVRIYFPQYRGQSRRGVFIMFSRDSEGRKRVEVFERDASGVPLARVWKGFYDEREGEWVRFEDFEPKRLKGEDRYRVQLEAWRLEYTEADAQPLPPSPGEGEAEQERGPEESPRLWKTPGFDFKNPHHVRRLLADLVAKAEDFDWDEAARNGELPPLKGRVLGEVDPRGGLAVMPFENYSGRWLALGFSDAGWRLTVTEAGVRDGHYQFTVRFDKADHPSLFRTFQIGPERAWALGHKKERGKRRPVFAIRPIRERSFPRFDLGDQRIVTSDWRLTELLFLVEKGREIPKAKQRLTPRTATVRGLVTIFHLYSTGEDGRGKEMFLSTTPSFAGKLVTPLLRKSGEDEYRLDLEAVSERTRERFVVASYLFAKQGRIVIGEREAWRIEFGDPVPGRRIPFSHSLLVREIIQGIAKGKLPAKLRRFNKQEMFRWGLLTPNESQIYFWSPAVRFQMPWKAPDSLLLRIDPAPDYAPDAWVASLWWEEKEIPLRDFVLYANGKFTFDRPFPAVGVGYEDVKGEVPEVKRTFRDVNKAFWYRYWLANGGEGVPDPDRIRTPRGRDEYLYRFQGETIPIKLGPKFSRGWTVRSWVKLPEMGPDARGVRYYNRKTRAEKFFVLFKNQRFQKPKPVRAEVRLPEPGFRGPRVTEKILKGLTGLRDKFLSHSPGGFGPVRLKDLVEAAGVARPTLKMRLEKERRVRRLVRQIRKLAEDHREEIEAIRLQEKYSPLDKKIIEAAEQAAHWNQDPSQEARVVTLTILAEEIEEDRHVVSQRMRENPEVKKAVESAYTDKYTVAILNAIRAIRRANESGTHPFRPLTPSSIIQEAKADEKTFYIRLSRDERVREEFESGALSVTKAKLLETARWLWETNRRGPVYQPVTLREVARRASLHRTGILRYRRLDPVFKAKFDSFLISREGAEILNGLEKLKRSARKPRAKKAVTLEEVVELLSRVLKRPVSRSQFDTALEIPLVRQKVRELMAAWNPAPVRLRLIRERHQKFSSPSHISRRAETRKEPRSGSAGFGQALRTGKAGLFRAEVRNEEEEIEMAPPPLRDSARRLLKYFREDLGLMVRVEYKEVDSKYEFLEIEIEAPEDYSGYRFSLLFLPPNFGVRIYGIQDLNHPTLFAAEEGSIQAAVNGALKLWREHVGLEEDQPGRAEVRSEVRMGTRKRKAHPAEVEKQAFSGGLSRVGVFDILLEKGATSPMSILRELGLPKSSLNWKKLLPLLYSLRSLGLLPTEAGMIQRDELYDLAPKARKRARAIRRYLVGLDRPRGRTRHPAVIERQIQITNAIARILGTPQARSDRFEEPAQRRNPLPSRFPEAVPQRLEKKKIPQPVSPTTLDAEAQQQIAKESSLPLRRFLIRKKLDLNAQQIAGRLSQVSGLEIRAQTVLAYENPNQKAEPPPGYDASLAGIAGMNAELLFSPPSEKPAAAPTESAPPEEEPKRRLEEALRKEPDLKNRLKMARKKGLRRSARDLAKDPEIQRLGVTEANIYSYEDPSHPADPLGAYVEALATLAKIDPILLRRGSFAPPVRAEAPSEGGKESFTREIADYPRLKHHPKLKIESKYAPGNETSRLRREKELQILDRQEGPITPARLAEALRQIPGYEGMKLQAVYRDIRLDSRLRNHPKLKKKERKRPVKKEVQKRRNQELAILDSLETPVGLRGLQGLLNQVPGYEAVSFWAVVRDTRVDPRLRNHPNRVTSRPRKPRAEVRIKSWDPRFENLRNLLSQHSDPNVAGLLVAAMPDRVYVLLVKEHGPAEADETDARLINQIKSLGFIAVQEAVTLPLDIDFSTTKSTPPLWPWLPPERLGNIARSPSLEFARVLKGQIGPEEVLARTEGEEGTLHGRVRKVLEAYIAYIRRRAEARLPQDSGALPAGRQGQVRAGGVTRSAKEVLEVARAVRGLTARRLKKDKKVLRVEVEKQLAAGLFSENETLRLPEDELQRIAEDFSTRLTLVTEPEEWTPEFTQGLVREIREEVIRYSAPPLSLASAFIVAVVVRFSSEYLLNLLKSTPSDFPDQTRQRLVRRAVMFRDPQTGIQTLVRRQRSKPVPAAPSTLPPSPHKKPRFLPRLAKFLASLSEAERDRVFLRAQEMVRKRSRLEEGETVGFTTAAGRARHFSSELQALDSYPRLKKAEKKRLKRELETKPKGIYPTVQLVVAFQVVDGYLFRENPVVADVIRALRESKGRFPHLDGTEAQKVISLYRQAFVENEPLLHQWDLEEARLILAQSRRQGEELLFGEEEDFFFDEAAGRSEVRKGNDEQNLEEMAAAMIQSNRTLLDLDLAKRFLRSLLENPELVAEAGKFYQTIAERSAESVQSTAWDDEDRYRVVFVAEGFLVRRKLGMLYDIVREVDAAEWLLTRIGKQNIITFGSLGVVVAGLSLAVVQARSQEEYRRILSELARYQQEIQRKITYRLDAHKTGSVEIDDVIGQAQERFFTINEKLDELARQLRQEMEEKIANGSLPEKRSDLIPELDFFPLARQILSRAREKNLFAGDQRQADLSLAREFLDKANRQKGLVETFLGLNLTIGAGVHSPMLLNYWEEFGLLRDQESRAVVDEIEQLHRAFQKTEYPSAGQRNALIKIARALLGEGEASSPASDIEGRAEVRKSGPEELLRRFIQRRTGLDVIDVDIQRKSLEGLRGTEALIGLTGFHRLKRRRIAWALGQFSDTLASLLGSIVRRKGMKLSISRDGLSFAIEEVLKNALVHGNRLDLTSPLYLGWRVRGARELALQVFDQASRRRLPVSRKTIKALQLGGHKNGLWFIKEIFKISYRRDRIQDKGSLIGSRSQLFIPLEPSRRAEVRGEKDLSPFPLRDLLATERLKDVGGTGVLKQLILQWGRFLNTDSSRDDEIADIANRVRMGNPVRFVMEFIFRLFLQFREELLNFPRALGELLRNSFTDSTIPRSHKILLALSLPFQLALSPLLVYALPAAFLLHVLDFLTGRIFAAVPAAAYFSGLHAVVAYKEALSPPTLAHEAMHVLWEHEIISADLPLARALESYLRFSPPPDAEIEAVFEKIWSEEKTFPDRLKAQLENPTLKPQMRNTFQEILKDRLKLRFAFERVEAVPILQGIFLRAALQRELEIAKEASEKFQSWRSRWYRRGFVDERGGFEHPFAYDFNLGVHIKTISHHLARRYLYASLFALTYFFFRAQAFPNEDLLHPHSQKNEATLKFIYRLALAFATSLLPTPRALGLDAEQIAREELGKGFPKEKRRELVELAKILARKIAADSPLADRSARRSEVRGEEAKPTLDDFRRWAKEGTTVEVQWQIPRHEVRTLRGRVKRITNEHTRWSVIWWEADGAELRVHGTYLPYILSARPVEALSRAEVRRFRSYFILRREAKVRGERIAIPRKDLTVSRSLSPVTTMPARPATAHSRTASSLGSRQTLNFTFGSTMNAFLWMSVIISSKISGVVNLLIFGFSRARRKSSRREGDRAITNLSSSRDWTIERQIPGKIMALTRMFASRTTRRIPFLTGLFDELEEFLSRKGIFSPSLVDAAREGTEAFTPRLAFKALNQGNPLGGSELSNDSFNLSQIDLDSKLRHFPFLRFSQYQDILSAPPTQNESSFLQRAEVRGEDEEAKAEQSKEKVGPKRRWLRFTLRQLLVGVALVAFSLWLWRTVPVKYAEYGAAQRLTKIFASFEPPSYVHENTLPRLHDFLLEKTRGVYEGNFNKYNKQSLYFQFLQLLSFKASVWRKFVGGPGPLSIPIPWSQDPFLKRFPTVESQVIREIEQDKYDFTTVEGQQKLLKRFRDYLAQHGIRARSEVRQPAGRQGSRWKALSRKRVSFVVAAALASAASFFALPPKPSVLVENPRISLHAKNRAETVGVLRTGFSEEDFWEGVARGEKGFRELRDRFYPGGVWNTDFPTDSPGRKIEGDTVRGVFEKGVTKGRFFIEVSAKENWSPWHTRAPEYWQFRPSHLLSPLQKTRTLRLFVRPSPNVKELSIGGVKIRSHFKNLTAQNVSYPLMFVPLKLGAPQGRRHVIPVELEIEGTGGKGFGDGEFELRFDPGWMNVTAESRWLNAAVGGMLGFLAVGLFWVGPLAKAGIQFVRQRISRSDSTARAEVRNKGRVDLEKFEAVARRIRDREEPVYWNHLARVVAEIDLGNRQEREQALQILDALGYDTQRPLLSESGPFYVLRRAEVRASEERLSFSLSPGEWEHLSQLRQWVKLWLGNYEGLKQRFTPEKYREYRDRLLQEERWLRSIILRASESKLESPEREELWSHLNLLSGDLLQIKADLSFLGTSYQMPLLVGLPPLGLEAYLARGLQGISEWIIQSGEKLDGELDAQDDALNSLEQIIAASESQGFVEITLGRIREKMSVTFNFSELFLERVIDEFNRTNPKFSLEPNPQRGPHFYKIIPRAEVREAKVNEPVFGGGERERNQPEVSTAASRLPRSRISPLSSIFTWAISPFNSWRVSFKSLESLETASSKRSNLPLTVWNPSSIISSLRLLPWTDTSSFSSLRSNPTWPSAIWRISFPIFSRSVPTSVTVNARAFLFSLVDSFFFIKGLLQKLRELPRETRLTEDIPFSKRGASVRPKAAQRPTLDSRREMHVSWSGMATRTASLRSRTSVSREVSRSFTSAISSRRGSTPSETARNSPRRSSTKVATSRAVKLSSIIRSSFEGAATLPKVPSSVNIKKNIISYSQSTLPETVRQLLTDFRVQAEVRRLSGGEIRVETAFELGRIVGAFHPDLSRPALVAMLRALRIFENQIRQEAIPDYLRKVIREFRQRGLEFPVPDERPAAEILLYGHLPTELELAALLFSLGMRINAKAEVLVLPKGPLNARELGQLETYKKKLTALRNLEGAPLSIQLHVSDWRGISHDLQRIGAELAAWLGTKRGGKEKARPQVVVTVSEDLAARLAKETLTGADSPYGATRVLYGTPNVSSDYAALQEAALRLSALPLLERDSRLLKKDPHFGVLRQELDRLDRFRSDYTGVFEAFRSAWLSVEPYLLEALSQAA